MKVLKKVALCYIMLVFVFFVSIFLVHLIPKSWMQQNVISSMHTIQKEGLYINLLNFKLFQLDNFTDAIMHDIAISADHNSPLRASMGNFYYRSDNFLDIAKDTEKVANGNIEGLKKVSYSRYWQGYLVVLKPLLTIFNYSQIRIIYYLLFTFLIGRIIFVTFKQNRNKLYLYSLLSVLVLFNVFIIPLSLQFSSVFIIALVAINILLTKLDKYSKEVHYLPLFFMIGGCTSFFDFLTAPLVTLGLPLVYLMESSQQKWKEKLITVFKIGVVWALGYGLIWASKWLLAGTLTDLDILNDVLASSVKRTSNNYKGMEMTIPNIISFIWQQIVNKGVEIFVYVAVLLFILLLFLYTKLIQSKKIFLDNLYLLLLVFIVPLWYLVLRNHSIQHGWFTWRASIVSVFALLIFILNTTKLTLNKKQNG